MVSRRIHVIYDFLLHKLLFLLLIPSTSTEAIEAVVGSFAGERDVEGPVHSLNRFHVDVESQLHSWQPAAHLLQGSIGLWIKEEKIYGMLNILTTLSVKECKNSSPKTTFHIIHASFQGKHRPANQQAEDQHCAQHFHNYVGLEVQKKTTFHVALVFQDSVDLQINVQKINTLLSICTATLVRTKIYSMLNISQLCR